MDSSEQCRLLALDFAEKDSTADVLEEQKKIIFAELVNFYRATEKAISAAEYQARADERYRQIEAQRANAKTAANIAKAELKSKELAFEFWRTREATKRQEMKL